MTAQHTPGPWEVVTNNRTNTLLIRPVGGMELITERPYAGDADSGLRARAEANARLIAAAPDLLAALEANLDNLELDAINEPELRGLLEDTRAAIRKATGEDA